MGGGDLNTKKTWHPSTLKNQERVWKAEQAAAEEKKRILELQRERALERDREELNELNRQNPNSSTNDNRLHWMYDKPDKKVQQEDYLLGKAIDKNYDQPDKPENEIAAVSRRVVGSSMLTTGGDVQVDLARKLREDPFLMVKERERAARAALLNNPVQRRRLAELLRKEQEQKNAHKNEKKSKKKGKDIDDLLAAKLNALSGEKGMNIAKLLESDDSSSDSSSDEKSKKKKKKAKKKKSKKSKDDRRSSSPYKKKKSKHNEKTHSKEQEESETEQSEKRKSGYDSDSPYKKKKNKHDQKIHTKEQVESETGHSTKRKSCYDSDSPHKKKNKNNEKTHSKEKEENKTEHCGKRKSDYDSDEEYNRKKHRREHSPQSKRPEKDYDKYSRDYSNDRDYAKSRSNDHRPKDRQDYRSGNKRVGLSEAEKAAKLAEMVAAGKEREVQRGKRVAEQRLEIASEKNTPRQHSSRNEARMLPDSLESRIHSNRHYIQRGQRHMNEHFARR